MTEQSEKETQPSAEEQATTAEDGAADESQAKGDAMNAVLQEKEELRALLQRVQADFVNYRNRVNAEREEIRQNAKKGLALRLLEIVDQFDDALATEPPEDMAASWLEGFKAIRKNLLSTLASEGIQQFESEGQPFDPREHDALLTETREDIAPNTVVRALRPGYRMNDDVLRAAQVQISVAPPENDENGEGRDEE